MLTELQVIERLRAACGVAGSQKAFAKAHGFTAAYVHDVLHSRRPPADRILAALGIERVIIYRETRNVAASVASAPPNQSDPAS